MSLPVVRLGEHRVVDPQPGEPSFLSAPPGTAWTGDRLYSVGDDQATVAEYRLDPTRVLEALRENAEAAIQAPGFAEPIIPEVPPIDPKERASEKADFEARRQRRPRAAAGVHRRRRGPGRLPGAERHRRLGGRGRLRRRGAAVADAAGRSLIKLEGVDARYNPTLGCIDLLLVSDADDPGIPAPLFAARLLR